ncbi:MAG: site-2 protease family protein [Gemmataceae bacterium]|nr:site-2 protease family protein [Gemmataceae bacterium]
MTGDIFLCRLFGIPFRLHWSWFLAIFLVSWTLATGFFPQTLPEFSTESEALWGLGFLAALGLFISVLLHELGHAIAARRLGVEVRGIRLFIFGGVAELGSEPNKAGHEIVIAVAGPVVTLLLILLYELGLTLIVMQSSVSWDLSSGILQLQGGSLATVGAAALLFYLGMINTFLLVFNMIPAFPLDGGRVLRGIIWGATNNYLTGTRVAGGIGIAFAYLLFIGGILNALGGNLFGGVWFFFLGMFLQNAAQSSIAYAQLQQLLRGVRVADMMRRDPVTVDAGLTLREVADEYFLRFPYKSYPVIHDGRYVGMLSLRALQEEPRELWHTRLVGDVVANGPILPSVKPNEPVLQAMRKLAESGQSRLAVVDDGTLVGLLCGRDVMDLMEIRAGLAAARVWQERRAA